MAELHTPYRDVPGMALSEALAIFFLKGTFSLSTQTCHYPGPNYRTQITLLKSTGAGTLLSW